MRFLGQSNRILSVFVDGDDALSQKLVIERFTGSDWLSRDFAYELLLLSEDDAITLEMCPLMWMRDEPGARDEYLIRVFEVILDKTERRFKSL